MKKNLALLFILLIAWIFNGQAQSLILKSKDGTIISKSLGSLKRFTFSGNSLLMNYLSGPIETYSLENISKLSFKLVTTDNLDLTETETIKIYPNPVRDIIYIQNAPETDFTVRIYRINGALALTSKSSSGSNTIDVSNLQSGLYLLNMNGRTFKIIKL